MTKIIFSFLAGYKKNYNEENMEIFHSVDFVKNPLDFFSVLVSLRLPTLGTMNNSW